ncbi:MAG: neutral/alkaline non-lysosomal ceramidase N-terminal domain-containing protein [bacterium]|nr:neutral/alkaline non-lysosomal ceramidase N-terminal domain-containing protein [bacterium]
MFKIGVSKIDITPPVGLDLQGFVAREGCSVGVHSKLFAKALVIDYKGKINLIVNCDLLAVNEKLALDIKSKIEKECGIKKENIIIFATHTHSGPATVFLRKCGEPDPKYINSLKEKIATCVSSADKKKKEAVIGIGKGKVQIGINRREKKGKEMIIGENPTGPIDTELSVIKIDTTAGKPIALIVNYSCHPVILGPENRHISGDYPAFATDFIEKNTGVPALFITGASANINPISGVTNSFKEVERLGKKIALETLRIKDKIKTRPVNYFKTANYVLQLSAGFLSSKEIEKEKKAFAKEKTLETKAKSEWAKLAHKEISGKKNPPKINLELNALAVNDIVFSTFPVELFVEVGLNIKKKSKFPNTIIGCYANGCVGYVPTKKEYLKKGYEIEDSYKYFGIYPLAPGTGELLQKIALKLINNLK